MAQARATDQAVEAFIARWQHAGGTERANYQLFLTELCTLLDLPQPDPAEDDTRDNAYVFERRVTMHNPDGSERNGFIDLYRRDCFVLEAKQSGKQLDSSGWDKAMLAAHNQADQYVRALPAEEGRPPFILVAEVGRNIELYAEFSRSGATYTPYPDPRSHRIRLTDLRDDTVRERLQAVWLDPLSLDPGRRSARVTRDIAARLATLAKSLEAAGHSSEHVAAFLMRCLFTMFAEDVGLLPERSFTRMLEDRRERLETVAPMLQHLWQTMNTGGFSPALEADLLRFNGGLFAECSAIDLDRDQLELLIEAARADWRYVEPAIFGTLLERALDPRERHKLGAHYTPRAYVERLVLPTIVEPLRSEWREVQTAALAYEQQGKHKEAVNEVRAFHRHLCEIRVLDPACGSGNFLYVTLEHMKRLEGEVLNLLHDLGESQGLLDMQGVTVDPHQFLGLEINPRAARIADAVLWIGYLQWHFRTHGRVQPPQPVLRDFHNIEHRDALIEYDAQELVTDQSGKSVTQWDGITYKPSPVTGESVPDESAQAPQYRYTNPRKAEWPKADYLIGNPPFIGTGHMRRALGDGYVDAVRTTWKELPESIDFVMYWWHIAANKVRTGEAQRFGFITTNSIRQTFNRRVLEPHLNDAKKPLSLAFAIPDHPWVDSADGADVRIAMSVGRAGEGMGRLLNSVAEQPGENERNITLQEREGRIFGDLSVGANVAGVVPLRANSELSSPGVKLHGSGFIVTQEQAQSLGLGIEPGLEQHIREYRNGRDLTRSPRGVMVIDLYGLSVEEVRSRFPAAYQWVAERVKPGRDAKSHTKDGAGYAKSWWLFGKPRQELRTMLNGLPRYIATVETTKHRVFQFLDAATLPDNMLVNVAVDDASILGILSSRVHAAWALAAGGRMGIGNDPRYNKTRCFETFALPSLVATERSRIWGLAEQLDAHRKERQAAHPELTLTGMYNVLEKERRGETLTARERTIHEQGLVSVLRDLHDELDRAVFEAYGWDDLAEVLVGRPGATTPLPDKPADQAEAEEELLSRLVALNAQRAAEEAKGQVRWLRPEFQAPREQASEQAEASLEGVASAAQPEAAQAGKSTWPKAMRDQVAAVRRHLAQQPHTLDSLAEQFKRKPKTKIAAVLDALEALGLVEVSGGTYQLRDG